MSSFLNTEHGKKIVASLTQGRIVALYIVTVALIPPVYGYFAGGMPAIFNYFAADSFIYLSVAAESQFGFYTFDGANPTTGFHPLWQMLLQALFQIMGITSDKVAQLHVVFWLSVALVTAGSALTAQSVYRWTGSALAAMLTFPGLYGLSLALFTPYNGNGWGFMNGMESPLSLIFVGLMFYFLSGSKAGLAEPEFLANRRNLVILSVLLMGIVFSRLDDIFLPAVILTWLLFRKSSAFSARLRDVLWVGLPLGSVISLYLLFNYLSAGHPLPISGAAKFDLRSAVVNLHMFGTTLRWLVPDAIYDPFTGTDLGYPVAYVNWRNAQMMAPLIVACFLLGRQKLLGLERGSSPGVLIRLLLWYVIAKALYNLLFVFLLRQGHWYYPISIVTVNVAGALIVVRLFELWRARTGWPRRIPIALAGAATMVFALNLAHARLDGPNPDYYYKFFQRGPEITAALKSRYETPRVIEIDDGIVNYVLDIPALSGFRFAIDRKAYLAFKNGRFLTEASRRGYQLIGSLHYFQAKHIAQLTTSEATTRETILEFLTHFEFSTQKDLDAFDFSLAYVDPTSGAVFFEFTPKR